MKKMLLFVSAIILLCTINSCRTSETVHNAVNFAHYVNDSLAQYVIEYTSGRVPFFNCTGNLEYNEYPGTAATPEMYKEEILTGDFIYRCSNGLYFGFPYNYYIRENGECNIYDITWDEASTANFSLAKPARGFPVDAYILVSLEKIKKYANNKEILSGDQILEAVNKMIEADDFYPGSTVGIFVDVDGFYSICYLPYEEYLEYIKTSDFLPKLDFLLESK